MKKFIIIHCINVLLASQQWINWSIARHELLNDGLIFISSLSHVILLFDVVVYNINVRSNGIVQILYRWGYRKIGGYVRENGF